MARDRNRRIVFASGVGLAQRIAQLVTALISIPLVLHALGVAGFGLWGAATSLAWLSGLLDLGLGSALVTLLPQALAGGDGEAARAYLSAALIGGCALGAAIFCAGWALVAHIGHPEQSGPLLVAVAGLALNVPLSIAGSAWFGLNCGHVAGAWELLQSGLTLALLITAAALHGGVSWMVAAVYGALVLANAGSLGHLLLRRSLGPMKKGASWRHVRSVLANGGLMFAVSVVFSCGYVLDNFLTLQWLGASASAQMAVAMRLCTTAVGMLAVVSQPLWPAFVEALSKGDRAWALRTLYRGTALVALLAAAGAIMIIAFGRTILTEWLRSDVGIGPPLMWAVGLWIVALATPRVAGLWFNAALVLRFQLAVAAASTALALTLKVFLSGAYGVAGILVSTPISFLCVVWPAFLWRALRQVDGPVPQSGAAIERNIAAR
jgi:O-antigen/teichoic acid export membrane protein